MTRLAFPTPGVRGLLVRSHNGAWGDETGSSRGITSPEDLRWMLANRAVSDAVLVSVGTAIKENYRQISLSDDVKRIRRDLGLSDHVALVVATASADRMAAALERANIVVTTESAFKEAFDTLTEKQRNDIIVAGDSVINWPIALTLLNQRRLVRIICEGGPQLINELIKGNLLNQLALTTSPLDGAKHQDTNAIDNFIGSQKREVIYKDNGFTFEFVGNFPQWDSRLTPEEIYVLRKGGTQAPFSVPYEKKPAPGFYSCRACGARLFDADTQFDARCGWPAFWKPSEDDAVRLITDSSMGMKRVEVRCKACDSHMGHVFEGEGFGYETDQRYCINAICLVRHDG